jgi:malate dehydrogenase (oxaloacetate-decarboxylating)(NADP+)
LRLIEWVSTAVAKAAMDEKVAIRPIADLEAYKKSLGKRLKASRKRMESTVSSHGW